MGETVTSRELWKFHGGLHLPGHKEESTGTPVVALPLPDRIVLPLQQHIGEPAEPVVHAGERVLKGQVVARAAGYVSAPVHAPTSGTVTAIAEHAVPHPSGLSTSCIHIQPDGLDTWKERTPVDYTRLDPSALRNVVREAGIVGLGGAGFPSFIKLNPRDRQALDTLIINGAECEPWITCDDMLMRERADEIIAGIRIMVHALQARHCIVGIEDNKPEAREAMHRALGNDSDIEIRVIPTIYPTGGEKQLIRVLTGREVPNDGLPLDIGVVCHNVATAAAISRAVLQGEPCISRYVTVTGHGVRQPRNVETLIGTPLASLLEFAGYDDRVLGQVLMGGPMMGFALHSLQAPVIKTTNCLLAIRRDEIPPESPAMPCIRCGECAHVCPATLLPQQLYWYAMARDFDRIQEYNLFDCIECGCCAYVCPSRIPLVQYYRFAKNSIAERDREKQKADLARQRHEFRLERLERDKREREERRQRKAAAVSAPGGADEAAKKAAIQAALERVRQKKEASQVQPRNVTNLTSRQKNLIEEVEARRTRLREAEQQEEQEQS